MDKSSPSSRSNVGKAIARGAVWTLAVRMVTRAISVVSTLILARLLTPADFGVYALAMTVYAFVELLRAFGFGSYLIQHQDSTDAHYNTAWTLHFLFSLITACLLFLLAPFAAEFLREPRLEIVVRFMCLLLLIDGVKNIGIINFQKHMTFDREFRFAVLTKLSGFLVTIPLAFLLQSYWAMLWGLLATSLMMLLLSYTMQPFRPRLDTSCWRQMISFTGWLQVNNILTYFNRHIENVLVSRMTGIAAVGSLQLAKETGQLLSEIAQPINRAAFPGYARVNRDPARMRDVFCDVMSMLMLVGFPISVGIYAIAHLFVPTVLGSQWLHIIPLVQLLSLSTLLLVIMSSVNNVLIALAWMKWATGIFALRLILMVMFLMYFLPLHGVIGVAYATIGSLSLVGVASYLSLRASLGLGLRRVAYLLYKPAVAALAMCLLVKLLFPRYWVDSTMALQILQLAAAVLTGAICYCLVLAGLWLLESRPDGPELKVLRLAHNRTGLFGFLLPATPPEKNHRA
ncbi:MAG: lipopolysaccharide biosynthesis protein [Porticoccaceae bacterium]|jgi:O-antigen/teichoic acid export membrane protein